MDEQREEREELAADDREAVDELREHDDARRYWNEDAREVEPFPSGQGRGATDAANKGKVKRRLKHEQKQGKRKHHIRKRSRHVKKKQGS